MLLSLRYSVWLLIVLFLLGGCATSKPHEMSDMQHEPQPVAHDMKHDMSGQPMMDHSAHMAMAKAKGYKRTVASYSIPDLVLTDQDGNKVSLNKLLHTDKPVIVNFLYATCTTICPLLSMGYIDLQRELGARNDEVMMISITIDPEHDTPEVLYKYRQKFNGKPSWTLLTGSRLDIDTVTTAFDAFFGDKMDHEPLNFIRMPDHDKWVRLNGMINGNNFVHELKMAGVWEGP